MNRSEKSGLMNISCIADLPAGETFGSFSKVSIQMTSKGRQADPACQARSVGQMLVVQVHHREPSASSISLDMVLL